MIYFLDSGHLNIFRLVLLLKPGSKGSMRVSICIFALFLTCAWSASSSSREEEDVSDNLESGPNHFQPMVAVLCGHGKLVNKYLDDNRRWVTDSDSKSVCTKDKLEILEYCRKVYPSKDITNIVESSRYFKIDSWCKPGQKKCKASHWVKPYRCLQGQFQSDALLVPEHCLFDHIHNQSICQTFDEWNQTAAHSCLDRAMHLRSFAMLLPCGVDMFSGVEFVCCPKNDKDSSGNTDSRKGDDGVDVDDDSEDDEDYDDEYYDDEDYDDEDESSHASSSTSTTTTTTTTSTTTERPVDYYYSHFDKKHEHEYFKEAQKSLEEEHRERVTKVMKEWTELEERYQEMKVKDSKAAEEFRKKMSARFQKTVEALEEEGSAAKRQMSAMHQQRILSIINMRKKNAMDCYTAALDQPTPKTKKIEKCLEKLLRALEKDRRHTLNHYRHLLNSNLKQAVKEKENMLEHLDSLNHIANQSFGMLDRVPSVAEKIRARMVAVWHHLHGLGPKTSITREVDEAILEKYKEEVAEKQKERERQKKLMEERRQELKELREEKKRIEAKNGIKIDREFDPESMEDESVLPSTTQPEPPKLAEVSGVEHNSLDHEEIPVPKVAHIQNQAFHHNEVTFSVRKESMERLRWNGSVYITLAFAGVALLTAMIVGIVLLRRHSHRSPQGQGFVEVDQAATPEERHVANMQINGYENPTYKYFEAQSN